MSEAARHDLCHIDLLPALDRTRGWEYRLPLVAIPKVVNTLPIGDLRPSSPLIYLYVGPMLQSACE